MAPCALHFAPHPDDEVLGAPATLLALKEAGYRVVNVACSLGRTGQHERRRAELDEALARVEFEQHGVEPVAMSSGQGDDLVVAGRRLVGVVTDAVAEFEPVLVVSPSPHDRHPGHELVARAVDEALRAGPSGTRWWMWGLWDALPLPTIGTRFGRERLDRIVDALAAHTGELQRADYDRFIRGRAEMYAGTGRELLFGFGAERTGAGQVELRRDDYVELLTEVVLVAHRWLLGRPRWLDANAVVADPSDLDVSDWLGSPSVTQELGPPGVQAAGEAA